MIRVAVNGLGRIGRYIIRLILSENDIQVKLLNDPNIDSHSLSLLLEYDSLYGRFEGAKCENNLLITRNYTAKIFNDYNILNLDLSNVDVLIESSGKISSEDISKLSEKYSALKIILTYDSKYVEEKIVFGFNENSYLGSNLISALTCDAIAMLPVINIARDFDIKSLDIISLHPYLSYQKLLDNPADFKAKYDMLTQTRSAIDNLIPKETSAGTICEYMIPELSGKVISYQMRVPTSCVSAAFLTIRCKDNISEDEFISKLIKLNPIVDINDKDLVSRDFLAIKASSVVDKRFFSVKDKVLRLLIWYDNEASYSNRILDLIKLVGDKNE